MNVREYLENYNEISDDIRRLNLELNQLLTCREETYNTLQAQVLSDMPRSPHEEGNDVVSRAALVIELYSKKIDRIIYQIKTLTEQQDVFNRIWFRTGLLSNDEKRIVDIRFFQKTHSNGKKITWTDIALMTSYCKEQCMRKADIAIEKLQRESDLIKGEAI